MIRLKRGGAVGALIVASAIAGLAQAPAPERVEGALKPGDVAPDFDLKELKSDSRVKLSSFRGRMPVALIFGSYT